MMTPREMLQWMTGGAPSVAPPAPPTAPPPPPPRPTIRNTITSGPYESAGFGRRAMEWHAPAIGPNDAALPALSTLRARSRAATRNDGLARAAIDRLVSNLIGTGIVPQSQAPDATFRALLQREWLAWTDEADADGVLDFYGLQALAVRSWLEGGEVFVRLRERLPEDHLRIPFQVQLFEGDQVPVEHNSDRPRVRAGVEFDPIGRRVAYYFHRRRPGAGQDLDVGGLVRIPARNVLHLYEPVRVGQIRGLPLLTQALIRFHEIDQFDDATIVRQKVASLFAGFIERQGSEADTTVDPLSGAPVETDAAGHTIVGLEPGLLQELPPGATVNFPAPPDASGYAEFMRTALMSAAIAADVPYEILTGDLRAVNDRTVRVVLNEFRRRVEQRQYHIVAHQLCRPVWQAWFDAAFVAGVIPVPPAYYRDPEAWRAVEWNTPSWAYLSPTADVQAARESVRAGFTSRSAILRERGFDPESVMREIANDNRVADAAGLTFDSDSRVAAPGAGATQTPTPTRAMQVNKIVLRDPVTQRIVSIKEIHTPLNGAPGANGRITHLGDDGGLT